MITQCSIKAFLHEKKTKDATFQSLSKPHFLNINVQIFFSWKLEKFFTWLTCYLRKIFFSWTHSKLMIREKRFSCIFYFSSSIRMRKLIDRKFSGECFSTRYTLHIKTCLISFQQGAIFCWENDIHDEFWSIIELWSIIFIWILAPKM